jgi:ABC-type branched-subunit amino acid transport system ATPase component
MADTSSTRHELLLQVSDLHAGYGRAEVLTGLKLQLPKGQVVTVIGPNGAGKSTLLNALMGVLPSRGQVRFDGQDLTGATLEDRVMMGLALVPEKRELFTTCRWKTTWCWAATAPCACVCRTGATNSNVSTPSFHG